MSEVMFLNVLAEWFLIVTDMSLKLDQWFAVLKLLDKYLHSYNCVSPFIRQDRIVLQLLLRNVGRLKLSIINTP